MSYGPYHRLGGPGGKGCPVATLRVRAPGTDGSPINMDFLDAGREASEVELLRTVAFGLGVQWGKDELGWWAAVPVSSSTPQ